MPALEYGSIKVRIMPLDAWILNDQDAYATWIWSTRCLSSV